MKITKKHKQILATSYIKADENDDVDMNDFDDAEFDDPDFDDEGFDDSDDDNLSDNVQDLADNVEDLQGELEGMEDDDPNIQIENNIDGRYIAECDRCGEIFISAITESDANMESIHGICPICDHESDQYLKWVIRKV